MSDNRYNFVICDCGSSIELKNVFLINNRISQITGSIGQKCV